MIQLSSEEKKIIVKIIATASNVDVILFGSRVKGTAKRFSDLDLCLKADDKVDLTLIGDLREKFENSNLPFRVDIVDYNRTNREFQTIIDREGEVLKQ